MKKKKLEFIVTMAGVFGGSFLGSAMIECFKGWFINSAVLALIGIVLIGIGYAALLKMNKTFNEHKQDEYE